MPGRSWKGYFGVPSVDHYLLVNTRNRTVIHHARAGEKGEIATRIDRDGAVRLDPPGIFLDVAGLFLGAEGQARR
jgi:hypothetical protein